MRGVHPLLLGGYPKPDLRTIGAGPGTITPTSYGYSVSGFADTCFAYLNAPNTAGKWYWEVVYLGNWLLVGITDDPTTAVIYGGYSSTNAGLYTSGGGQWVDSGWTGHAVSGAWGGGAFSVDDVIGFALDLDSATKSLKFYQNGGYGAQVQWTSGPASLWPMIGFQGGPAAQIRLGADGCNYSPPAGYSHL